VAHEDLPAPRPDARARMTQLLAKECTLMVVLRDREDDRPLCNAVASASDNPFRERRGAFAATVGDVRDMLVALPGPDAVRAKIVPGAWLVSCRLIDLGSGAFGHELADAVGPNEQRPNAVEIEQAYLRAEV
jgi:hypothetical protein